MSYELQFLPQALREWYALDGSIRAQLKHKLAEHLLQPCVPSCRLSGKPNRYKIKLRKLGYRLVYEVRQETVVVLVLAVGRRDHDSVYRKAEQR